MTQIFDRERWRSRTIWVWGLALAVLTACSGNGPAAVGLRSGKLAPCPASPNCVCSDAGDEAHRVAPYIFKGAATDAWEALKAHVAALPKSRVVNTASDYLHVTFRSPVFGFIDDVEFNLRPAAGMIAVRSASRTGYFDLGVNRRRVEAIRSHLRDQGFLQGGGSQTVP